MALPIKPELAALVGRRVSLRNGWETYPLGIWPAGTTGTVESYDPGVGLYVALDVHYPELDEWNNRLELYDWQDPERPLIEELEIITEEGR